jgi:hypothetical protein
MNLQTIIDHLMLKVLTEPAEFSSRVPSSGYVSDLLSCVMAGAKKDGIWVTLQCHDNIVAVAALLDVTAVIISEDAQPDPSTIARANSRGITLLSSPQSSFSIVGQLWELGLRSE